MKKMANCVVCGKSLPKYKSKFCSDECRRVQVKKQCHEWYLNNREKVLRRSLEYYQNNQVKISERSRKYYQDNQKRIIESRRERHQNNPEKVKEYHRRYYQDNQEKKKKYRHEHYQNNRARILKNRHEWYLNNKEKVKERNHKYYQNNREALKESAYKYYLNNREKKKKLYRLSHGLPEDWNFFKESSIEVIMRRWLQEFDVDFIQHYFINFEGSTKTYVDFYIPKANVCLYCDGDYWHGPKRPDIQERDVKINKALEAKEHVVIRLSESEILTGVRPVEILELIQ